MKTRMNRAEITEVMTYGAIDGLSTPRLSIGGNRHQKKMLLKEDWVIMNMCGAMEAIDGPLSLRWTTFTFVIANRK